MLILPIHEKRKKRKTELKRESGNIGSNSDSATLISLSVFSFLV